MSWTHPESTFLKKRISDALAIQLPSSSQFQFSAHITCESSYISITGDFVTAEKLQSIIIIGYAGAAAEDILLGERRMGSYGTKGADVNNSATSN